MGDTQKILILGASGLVGSQVATILGNGNNHDIYCGARDTKTLTQRLPQVKVIYCNFLEDTSIDIWLPRLKGIDVVINCVGIFYHRNKNVIWQVHYETPKVLFEAAKKSKVKKIIQLSALGIEHYNTEYAKSKMAAEKFLTSLKIQHIILRPSLIYGANARGSMALMKSLSALPLIPLPGHGEQLFQPIHTTDLANAIKHIIEEDFSDSMILAAVSSETISLKNMFATIRQWLGLKPPSFVYIPMRLIRILGRLGSLFFYRTINTPAINMLEQGNVATSDNTKQFQEKVNLVPKNFREGMQSSPCSIQDYWHARLFFLRPLLRITLALMWLFTGLTSLALYPHKASYFLLNTVGIPALLQPVFLYGASILDGAIGLSLLINYKTKINCIIQIILILLYTLIISFKLPYFWLDPFGPIVKNIPLLVSILILYVTEPRR